MSLARVRSPWVWKAPNSQLWCSLENLSHQQKGWMWLSQALGWTGMKMRFLLWEVIVWGRWAVFEFFLHSFWIWEVTEVPRGQGDAALSEHFLEHRKEETMWGNRKDPPWSNVGGENSSSRAPGTSCCPWKRERNNPKNFPWVCIFLKNFPFSQEERDLAIIMKTLHWVQRCLLAVQGVYPSASWVGRCFPGGVLWDSSVSLTNGGSSTDLPVASSPCEGWIPSLVQFSVCLAFRLLAIN